MDNENRDDLISAALDGEPVDVDALRRVLGTEDGRESLAAFLMLRAATAADALIPSRPLSQVVQAVGPPRIPMPVRSRLRLACAASVALLTLLGAFWFGSTLRAPVTTLTLIAPPTVPTMTATLPRVDTPANAAAIQHPATAAPLLTVSPRRTPLEPPKPTRSLSFVPGVDWTSTPR